MSKETKAVRAASDAAQLVALTKVEVARPKGPRIDVELVTRPEGTPTMSPEAFYGPIGQAVLNIAAFTEADPAAVLATVLAYAGSIIGPNSWFEISGVTVNAGLYVLVVGPTALGRKGTSHSVAKKLLGTMADVRSLVGLASGEALVNELCKEGLSNEHIMIIEEEFARLLGSAGRTGSTLSPMIRQAFDGGDLGHTTVTATDVASGYHSSVIGHITPDELRLCLSASDQSNGLANRFMMIASHATKVVTWDDQGDPNHQCVKTITDSSIAEIAARGAGRGRIPLSDGAFNALSMIHRQGMVTSSSTLLARLMEHLWRLTLIYAVMDEATEIQLEHVKAALAFVHYVRATTEMVFGDSDVEPKTAKILSLIIGAGTAGLSKTELSTALSNHIGAKERDRHIEDLLAKGLITVALTKTPGRSGTIYVGIGACDTIEAEADISE